MEPSNIVVDSGGLGVKKVENHWFYCKTYNLTEIFVFTPFSQVNNTIAKKNGGNSPIIENDKMTAPSMISMRRCVARDASLPAPALLFLRVAYKKVCFTAHHRPVIRKKLPGNAWPLKLPMISWK